MQTSQSANDELIEEGLEVINYFCQIENPAIRASIRIFCANIVNSQSKVLTFKQKAAAVARLPDETSYDTPLSGPTA